MASIGEASTFQALIDLMKDKLVQKEEGKGLFSGSYNDLTDAPESLPASDVHAWAKAANKPSYTPIEIGAIGISQVGMTGGVASLGNDGKVPSSQLPEVSSNITAIAPAFSDIVNYDVGDYLTYSGDFYKCTSPHSAGPWDANDFTMTSVEEEFMALSKLGAINGAASLGNDGKIPDIQIPTNLIHSSQIGVASGVAGLDANGYLDLDHITKPEIQAMWGGSGGSGSFFLVGDSDQSSYTYTVVESGTYLVMVAYPHNGSGSITFSDATIIDEQTLTIQQRGAICKIAEVEAGETITATVGWTSWNGRVLAIIKLNDITIDELVNKSGDKDTWTYYTLPDDNDYYLVYGFGLGHGGKIDDRTNYISLPSISSEVSTHVTASFTLMKGAYGFNSISSISIYKGSESPEYAFYGYDGGFSAVFAWRLA